MSVPVRRGTGPKARLLAFLKAFDAYIDYTNDHAGGPRANIDREEHNRLFIDMVAKRNEITTVMGMGS
jgi:hypothetical protein